jgi:hypothetical protein
VLSFVGSFTNSFISPLEQAKMAISSANLNLFSFLPLKLRIVLLLQFSEHVFQQTGEDLW